MADLHLLHHVQLVNAVSPRGTRPLKLSVYSRVQTAKTRKSCVRQKREPLKTQELQTFQYLYHHYKRSSTFQNASREKTESRDVTWAAPRPDVTWAGPRPDVTWAGPRPDVTWAGPRRDVMWTAPRRDATWGSTWQPFRGQRSSSGREMCFSYVNAGTSGPSAEQARSTPAESATTTTEHNLQQHPRQSRQINDKYSFDFTCDKDFFEYEENSFTPNLSDNKNVKGRLKSHIHY